MTQLKQLKVFIFPIDATGHINACIGIGQALIKRGHKVYFLSGEGFAGQYVKFGFEEILLKKQAKPVENDAQSNGQAENPIKVIAEQLMKTGLMSGKSPMEKAGMFKDNEFMNDVYEATIQYHSQVEEAIKREQPDVIVVDHFIVSPCILYGKIPWIMSFSGNPLGLYESSELPPCMFGLPSDDRTEWEKHEKYFKEHLMSDFQKYQNDLLKYFNYPQVEKHDTFLTKSKYLNIYGYPKELDYDDIVPIPENFFRVDAYCRELPEPFELPAEFKAKIKDGDKLIYISMGSMGSIDVDLMKRLVGAFANHPTYKCVVSKGPLTDQYELPDNMWGEAHLPQTSILPLVDLVITHGGNNTVTETFSFGKPMIVMPLFGDQFDNAQRVQEKGYGLRMDPYRFEASELVSNSDQLLTSEELRTKLEQAKTRIQQSNSKEQLAIKIEQICEKTKAEN